MSTTDHLLRDGDIVFPSTDEGVMEQMLERVLQVVAGQAVDHPTLDNTTAPTVDTTTTNPDSLASNTMLAILLTMIVILAIYFCCMQVV